MYKECRHILPDGSCCHAAGRIYGTNAGRLIYGLQIASQFAPSFPRSPAGNPVESLTRTSDSDELAPESIKCFKDDDCDTCFYRNECGGVESGGEDEDANDEDKAWRSLQRRASRVRAPRLETRFPVD